MTQLPKLTITRNKTEYTPTDKDYQAVVTQVIELIDIDAVVSLDDVLLNFAWNKAPIPFCEILLKLTNGFKTRLIYWHQAYDQLEKRKSLECEPKSQLL